MKRERKKKENLFTTFTSNEISLIPEILISKPYILYGLYNVSSSINSFHHLVKSDTKKSYSLASMALSEDNDYSNLVYSVPLCSKDVVLSGCWRSRQPFEMFLI